MSEIEDVCKDFVVEWLNAFRETGQMLGYYNRRLLREAKKLRKNMNRLAYYLRGGKRPRYYRTGIKPKYQNRTRKKQRLTRLQRRWKRQRK